MSEPYGALLKLHIARPALVRWLTSAPPSPTRWTDWRSIGGSWYLEDAGPGELARASDATVARCIADAAALLARWPTVRQAIRGLIRDPAAIAARRVTYDGDAQVFVAGTLYYDEGLIPFIAFLALARGSEDFLGERGAGVATIHDYVFAPDADDATAAVLTLGPGRSSHLLVGDDRTSAVAVFQGIADAMLVVREKLPTPVDDLDGIR